MNQNHLKSLKRCRRANGTHHRSAFAATSFILTASLLTVLLASCPSPTPTPDDVPDNAAPGAPDITTTTPGDGKVTLVWTAPSNTGITGGDGTTGVITKYTVYHSESTITDLTAAGVTAVDVTIGLTAEVSLTNGTQYYFKVTATNATGESTASTETSATPAVPPANAAPGVPTLTSTTAGPGKVTLEWTAPASTGFINGDGTTGVITKYTVYYSTSTITDRTAAGVESVDVTGATTLTKEVTGLAGGTEYYFVVTAWNAAGESEASNESSATTTVPPDAAPGAPTNLQTIAGNKQVTVSWTAPTDTGYINDNGTVGVIIKYIVYYDTDTIVPGNLPTTKVDVTESGGTVATTADVPNLTGGTEYFFRVTATNGTGEGDPSDQVSNTPTVPPNAPPGAPNITDAATDLAGNIQLTWSEPSFTGYINGDATPGVITGYTVYYTDSSTRSGDSSWGKNDAVSTVPIADENLSTRDIFLPENVGQEIFFKMTATNAIGEGELSDEASATVGVPHNTPPGAPAITATVVGNGQVTLSWTAPAHKGFSNSDGTYGPITAYTVYYHTASFTDSSKPTDKVEVSGGTLTADVTPLTNGTKYYFRVTATNATGEGALSNESLASPATATPADAVPGAPTITAAAGDGEVTISWTALTDTGFTGGNGTVGIITAYTVYYDTSGFDASNLPTTKVEVSGTAATAVVPNLPNATLHYFGVTATNATGEGNLSNQESATPEDETGPTFTLSPISAATGATSLTIAADEPIRLIGNHGNIVIVNNYGDATSQTIINPEGVSLGSDEVTVTITIPPTNFLAGHTVYMQVEKKFAQDKATTPNKNELWDITTTVE